MRGGRGRARRSASRCDGAATVSRARCVSKSDPSRAFRNLPLAPRRAGHISDAQGGSRGGAPGRQGLSAAMTPRLSVRLPVKRRAKIKPSQLVFNNRARPDTLTQGMVHGHGRTVWGDESEHAKQSSEKSVPRAPSGRARHRTFPLRGSHRPSAVWGNLRASRVFFAPG